MRLSTLFAGLLVACVACAPDSKPPQVPPQSPPQPMVTATAASVSSSGHAGHAVSLANGGSGYLALPEKASGPLPAILVIQEFWGMNEWIVSNADRFAGQGYAALAVDLYRGRITASADEAHELMRGLPEDRGLADIKAAMDLLAARPDVDPSRIGIVGWCMGGGYALDFATIEPRLRSAVVNYGHLFTDTKKIDAIHAALLGNFGAADRGIPKEDVVAFQAELRAKGKTIDFKEYDGAGHAFMNPNNKQGYSDAAAKDAWARIDAFFVQTLKTK